MTNKFLAALEVAIQPIETAVEQKLESVGASFLAGLAVIGVSFTNDQRDIGAKVIGVWQAKHHEATAAGATEIDAIEQASTAAYNEFCADEAAEFSKESDAIITLLRAAATSAISGI